LLHLLLSKLGSTRIVQTKYENTRPALIDDGEVHPTMDYEGPEGECRYSCTLCLTSALHHGGGGVFGLRHTPACLPLGMTWCPLYGRLGVGLRAGLDVYRKSHPHQDSIPRLSNLYSLAIPTELSRTSWWL